MLKEPDTPQSPAPLSKEKACEYVAELSRELADISRRSGLNTIAGLLDLASDEAAKHAAVRTDEENDIRSHRESGFSPCADGSSAASL